VVSGLLLKHDEDKRVIEAVGSSAWIGDPSEIKAKRVERQTFDREDARPLLRLLRENNFPQIWVPGPENRMARSPSSNEI
jgi:hypothetical protein